MWDYPSNLHCSFEYETRCDPETHDIEIGIGMMSIGGGDERCSEDSIQFTAPGGVRNLGDLRDTQGGIYDFLGVI